MSRQFRGLEYDTNRFLSEITRELAAKKAEYDQVRTGGVFFPDIRAKLTRYLEKVKWVQNDLVPALNRYEENPNHETKRRLLWILNRGADEFSGSNLTAIIRKWAEALFTTKCNRDIELSSMSAPQARTQ